MPNVVCFTFFLEKNDLTSNNMHLVVNQVEFLQIAEHGKELEFATMVADNNNSFFDWEVRYTDTEGVQIFSRKVHRIVLVSSG